MSEYQPYFQAFLLHTGADPNVVRNCEYILWISQKWTEWRKLHGLDPSANISLEQHEQFTTWLFETVPVGQLEMPF